MRWLLAPLVFIVFSGACAPLDRAAGDSGATAQRPADPDPERVGLDLDEDGHLPIPSDQMWCEYKCANFPGRWRAADATDVYAAPLVHARIVGQLSPGEAVDAVRYERRVRPRRGVVQRAGRGLEAGEVVHMIGGTEDTILLIRGGVRFELWFDNSPEDAEIAFEGEYESVDWVFVERDGRPNGWLRNPQMPGMDFPLED